MKRNHSIRVAIIDDGCFGQLIPQGRHWNATMSGVVPAVKESRSQEETHASICVKIIQKYADCSNVEWYDIQALDLLDKSGNLSSFIRALHFCRKLQVDVLHLSIGSTYPMDFPAIKEAIDLLLDSGTIIIAAGSNQGVLTYPANLSGVIGVVHDLELKDNGFLPQYDGVTGINFRASSRHFLRRKGTPYLTPVSNSYAAPVLTAAVIKELSISPELSREELLHRLIGNIDDRIKPNLLHPLGVYDHAPVIHIVNSEEAKKRLQGMLQPSLQELPRIEVWPQIKNGITSFETRSPVLRVVFWESNSDAVGVLQRLSEQKTLSFLVYDIAQAYFFYSGNRYPICSPKNSIAVQSKPEECTVIAISGFHPEEILFLMKNLQARFWREEYYPVGISDIPCSGLFGFFSVPAGKPFFPWEQQIINFAAPSVLLVGLSNSVHLQSLSSIDYHIKGPPNLGFQLSNSNQTENMDNLFEKIKSKLS